MKHLILILFTSLFAFPVFSQFGPGFVEKCAVNSGKDATYLKDFQVVLNAAQPEQVQPIARYPLVLSKNNIYRFSVCTRKILPVRQFYSYMTVISLFSVHIIKIQVRNIIPLISYVRKRGSTMYLFPSLMGKRGML